MTSSFIINRFPTGVPGMDEVLGGGIPEFSFNLIAGTPGSGKTTLAHQIMFALAKPDRPALYLTVLGEPPLKMLRYQQQFDFFDSAMLNDSVDFVNLAEESVAGDLNKVLKRIVLEVEARNPSFLFVDSFRSVVQSGGNKLNAHNDLQQFMQRLAILMTGWQATTFLIGEYFTDTDANPVFTVADGLIWLRQSVQRNSMVRKMEIMKLRGQSSLPGLHAFRMSSAGIEVFPSANTRSTAIKTLPVDMLHRLKTGVSRLDDMLNGGLPKGYSLLVAGPSGSGKSVLATSFLAEGAECGEAGVLAAFEQRATRSQTLSDLISGGNVTVLDTHASDISIDEVLGRLLNEIRRVNAVRLVIDSLSGFELALAPTFRADFRESLSLMVTALASTGVTTLMTSELEDRYTDLRFSPYGTAFLTDAIIVQRYIEVGSRLRRVMAVVKLRGSSHSNELREFTIDDGGLQIGEMLVNQEGLLGGRPSTKGIDENQSTEKLDGT